MVRFRYCNNFVKNVSFTVFFRVVLDWTVFFFGFARVCTFHWMDLICVYDLNSCGISDALFRFKMRNLIWPSRLSRVEDNRREKESYVRVLPNEWKPSQNTSFENPLSTRFWQPFRNTSTLHTSSIVINMLQAIFRVSAIRKLHHFWSQNEANGSRKQYKINTRLRTRIHWLDDHFLNVTAWLRNIWYYF